MTVLDDAAPAHARWSELNEEFLRFAAREPACMRRESFAELRAEPTLASLSVQPWPLFVGGERLREARALAPAMDRLVKGVLERFLDNDPARIARFYRHCPPGGTPVEASEDMVAFLLEEPNGVASAPSRADYIDAADGLKCIEFNAGSCLGGLHAGTVAELYLRCAPTARFLAERGRAAAAPAVMRAFFRHVVEDTVRLGVWEGGPFNVAMVVRPHDASWLARHSAEAYTRDLRAVLAAHGPTPEGEVLLCGLDDFAGGGTPAVDGKPVHAVIEQHNGEGDVRPLFRAFKLGLINLFSGPIGEMLSDKRSLALLSTHAASDELTAEERALVARHLPWTRVVAPGVTDFRGRALRLPEDLPALREEMVLKKASSVGGDFVEVGRYRTPDAWNAAIARAVREGDWVVQEYLETVPYVFLTHDGTPAAHELVWGLFAFGGRYGGAFLRMDAAGRHGGVVNTRRGSEVGATLEV